MDTSDSNGTITDSIEFQKCETEYCKTVHEVSCPSAEDDVEGVDDQAISSEDDDRGIGGLYHVRSRTRSSADRTVISWDYGDLQNPHNWSSSKKGFVAFLSTMLVINSTMGSTLPSMAMDSIMARFSITAGQQRALPISIYLVGYFIGPNIWGPLSEHYGRRFLSIMTFGIFFVFTLTCAFAPNWSAFLVFRLICGICGSCPVVVVAGILADIYNEPRTRGKAFAIFMVAINFGPLLAPILSGFCSSTIGWRWTFYIAAIAAGLTFVAALFLPETFGPSLLARRAARLRKEEEAAAAAAANSNPLFPYISTIVAPRDLEKTELSQLIKVVCTRPIRMIFSEPIVAATCAYLALVYTIFYMSFQAFPIIFQRLYGLSPGVTGLCYLPIGGGAICSLPVFWYWDHFLHNAAESGKSWTKREEARRLPLAFVGGPMFVLSLFWLGWTARPGVSFVVPMLAGFPFGFGFLLVFMALINYLTDAYDYFAASANAAASTCRSLLAVLLPLATAPMFRRLGISGACSLLGGLSALMCVIPYIFVWKGPSLRDRSPFCMALRERREEMQRKAEEQRLGIEHSQIRTEKEIP